jgi:putative FmdB family regulatory protein
VPIYEYACKSCGHTLDALQKMSDDPLVECPECGKSELRRLIAAPRFRLKGGGWYETDFKKDNQRNVLKGDAEPEKKSASASGGTSEAAKTAEKPSAPASTETKTKAAGE